MFGLGGGLRYYLYRGPADMRKGFDGLCGLVDSGLGMDPTDGSVYIFANRRRDRIKLLHWQQGGFPLYYKCLEAGTFALPPSKGPKTMLTHAQ
jgi:transposase